MGVLWLAVFLGAFSPGAAPAAAASVRPPGSGLAPQDFTMQRIFDRLNVVGDLWARLRTSHPADLRAAFRYVPDG